jgi:hypothetical protein
MNQTGIHDVLLNGAFLAAVPGSSRPDCEPYLIVGICLPCWSLQSRQNRHDSLTLHNILLASHPFSYKI